METYAQIKSNLKELRLKSVLENIESRNSEAIKSKMSYMDFLLAVTQDEIDRRRFTKKESRVKILTWGGVKILSSLNSILIQRSTDSRL